MPFSVLTFNMQFGQGWDEKDPDHAPVNLKNTLSEIRSMEADVVLLQEVERVDPDNGQVDPPPNYSFLKDALPEYHGVFAYPKRDERELPFGYALAIFSRTRLYDFQQWDLPAPDIEFQFNGQSTQPTARLLIGVRTQIEGREVQLFNTHLQAFFMIRQTSDEYRQQRDVIADRLRESSLPTVIGGDFNAAPDENTIAQFEATGFRTVQKETITWRRMPYVLDHLLYNADQLLSKRHWVVTTDASDHKLLKAEFEFLA